MTLQVLNVRSFVEMMKKKKKFDFESNLTQRCVCFHHMKIVVLKAALRVHSLHRIRLVVDLQKKKNKLAKCVLGVQCRWVGTTCSVLTPIHFINEWMGLTLRPKVFFQKVELESVRAQTTHCLENRMTNETRFFFFATNTHASLICVFYPMYFVFLFFSLLQICLVYKFY